MLTALKLLQLIVMDTFIVNSIKKEFSSVQAIYLYGSYGDNSQRPESDVDIALLLPHDEAKKTGSLAFSDIRFRLEQELKHAVDLINQRIVPIVLQKEVITSGRCLYCIDQTSRDTYEMHVLSLFGKLNEERKEILQDFYRTNRAYNI
jgi:uncharacterized protein